MFAILIQVPVLKEDIFLSLDVSSSHYTGFEHITRTLSLHDPSEPEEALFLDFLICLQLFACLFGPLEEGCGYCRFVSMSPSSFHESVSLLGYYANFFCPEGSRSCGLMRGRATPLPFGDV